MCGIYGMVAVGGANRAAPAEWQRIARALAVVSTERGLDSAGVARLDIDGGLDHFKAVGPSWELFGSEGWDRVTACSEKTFALIGHTRLATHGSITEENAHPFVFEAREGGHICGVHNGVISNHTQLTASVTARVHAVDSANLFKAMAHTTDWAQVWRKVAGSLAIAVLRTQKPALIVARNHNPVAFAALPSLGIIVFASTSSILSRALKAAGFKDVSTVEMKEFTALTFKPGDKAPKSAKWYTKKEQKKSESSIVWGGNDDEATDSYASQTAAMIAAEERAEKSLTYTQRMTEGRGVTAADGRVLKRALKQAHAHNKGKHVTAKVGETVFVKCSACEEWRPKDQVARIFDTDVCQKCRPFFTQAMGRVSK